MMNHKERKDHKEEGSESFVAHVFFVTFVVRL
jgi:hypothetical protein